MLESSSSDPTLFHRVSRIIHSETSLDEVLGQVVSLTVLRNGKTISISVTLGAAPTDDSNGSSGATTQSFQNLF